MATYRSLAQYDPNSGAQTTFDSLGGLEGLARQLGWGGAWKNGVYDPSLEGQTAEQWLRQQGYDLSRMDGLTGPNGRQATDVSASNGGQTSTYTNEARPEQSIGGLFGDIAKDFVLPSAAMYFGGNALMGGGGAVGGMPSTQAIGLLGAGAPEMAVPGLTSVSSLGSMPAVAGAAAGGALGAGLGGSQSLGMLGQASVPEIASQTSWLNDSSGGMNLGKLAAGLLGAATSRSGTSTQTREPWQPAQDWLKSLIGRGQELQQQYTNQPFSPTQQQAATNLFGVANAANAAAPGLLQGLGALGRGYDRNAANRTQTGYSPTSFDLSSLLKMIPTFGGRNG